MQVYFTWLAQIKERHKTINKNNYIIKVHLIQGIKVPCTVNYSNAISLKTLSWKFLSKCYDNNVSLYTYKSNGISKLDNIFYCSHYLWLKNFECCLQVYRL